MRARRLLRMLGLATVLAGATVAALPAELTAATCTADSGAKCECSGACEAGKYYCWCKPPAA